MSSAELYNSAGLKFVLARLDEAMRSRGVADETRERVLTCFKMMYEYVPYAIKQGKDPTDAKVLRDFLLSKGQDTLKLFGNDALNCGLATVDFVLSATRAGSISMSGNVPGASLAWALAAIDLIDVGNSCDIAQQAYYEAFLRSSSVPLGAARRRYTAHPERDRWRFRP